MIVAEDVGLYKFDILSQRGLGHIRDAVEIIAENRGEEVDIRNIPAFKSDPAIRNLLRCGRTMGCFYVESPAMRMLLSKLQTDTYIGLVAASSIIRPGVAKSGMMREYILRHRFPDRRKEALPVMLEIMPETYGVMVYQEDVIKVAHYFAGLTLAEADVLRRGMSGKYRSREEFARVRDRFFKNCNQKGYDPVITADVWRQTESFAGYAFSKGHSASYAVESYQSLYLKAHYPLEFMVGVINNFGGFYSTEFYIHEARMSGGIIEAPCVNNSDRLTVIRGKQIYLGFILVKNLESRVVRQICTERQRNACFKSFQDFLQRIPISLEQVSILIRINAFRFTGKDKKELLWEAHWSLSKHEVTDRRNQLFPIVQKRYQLPQLLTNQIENAYDEIELLGFPLCSPFALLRDPVQNEHRASDLRDYLNQKMVIYGYLVTTKVTKTTRGDRMGFGTWIDRDGYFFDTVHFPDVLRQFPFRGRAIYRISGKVTEEFGFYTLEVNEIYRESYVNAEPGE
jgi:DNA polymerase-3 subunit alpha